MLPRLFPNLGIPFFVERRAAGGELAQLVMLGAHQSRAIAESAADAFAVEPSGLLKLSGEIRLGERGAADADKANSAIADIGGSSLEQIFLQVAVAAADHWHLWKCPLHLFGKTKMSIYPD